MSRCKSISLAQLFGVLFLALFSLAAPGRAWAQGAKRPIVFRTLLVVKALGDIHSDRYLKVQYEMTPEDIRVITRTFERDVPILIDRITDGRVQWQADVRVSPVPLRTIHTGENRTGVVPEDIGEDINAFAPQGKYDAIFVYWKAWDDETNYRMPGPFGWAISNYPSSNYSGFASIQYGPPSIWTFEADPPDVFIHEWLHMLEGFYGSREGVKSVTGGLHSGEAHGYKFNERNWRDWYQDLLNAQVEEDDGLKGLGEAAWKHGTMREDAARRPVPGPRNPPRTVSADKIENDAIRTSPAYLTPARRARNLLRNADFQNGDDGSWTIQSWKNNKQAASLVPDAPNRGDVSLQIATEQPDDIKLVQRVPIKPKTNYLMTGWVATRGVRIIEQGGQFGVSIGKVNGGERTPALLGDNDWRYVATAFYSGDSTEIEVCARLGGIASTSVGAAMFHDLCLIEVTD